MVRKTILVKPKDNKNIVVFFLACKTTSWYHYSGENRVKHKKIIVICSVGIMVLLIIGLFPLIFNFEGNKKDEYKKINDELVNSLYANLYSDEYLSRYTFYNAYFTKYGNLARDYILKVGFKALQDNHKLQENTLTTDELTKENITDAKPLYKISIKDLQKVLQNIFGKDININYGDFAVDQKIKGHYVEAEASIYIYEVDNTEENYYIFRQKESYAINADKTVIIYDYFVKCNRETGLCYNDDRMANLNEKIVYENGSINTTEAGNLAKYQHKFKLENGAYYWYSSEIIEK